MAKIFMPLALKARIVAHFGAQHCSSLWRASIVAHFACKVRATNLWRIFAAQPLSTKFVPLTLQAK